MRTLKKKKNTFVRYFTATNEEIDVVVFTVHKRKNATILALMTPINVER